MEGKERERERGRVKATKWCDPQMGGGTRAKKHMDWERHGDAERMRRGKREGRRWERRRERQIERTGWEVFYPSSPSSKTLISSIDSWLFRSLAVKCSSHAHICAHTHTFNLSFPHIHTGVLWWDRVIKYHVVRPRITLKFPLHK